MKRLFVAVLVLIASCGGPPIEDAVTIEFHEGSADATITSRRTFRQDSKYAPERARIAAARDAAVLGTDPWSIRFERIRPDSERITFDRERGELASVTHSAVVPAEAVERFFSDSSLTTKVSRGDGWSELAIYPGTSNRASREQQRHFDEALTEWSRRVARYYTEIDHVYAYLRTNPQRARYVFAAILEEKGVDGAPPMVLEEEQPLVDSLFASMDAVAAAMDEQADRASTLAEEADLIHNPFPARLTVKVPGPIVAREGFASSRDSRSVIVEPIDLFACIAALDGRWVHPDPLALLLKEERITAAELASIPRRSSAVTSAREVEDAIRSQLNRPQTFVVRWRD